MAAEYTLGNAEQRAESASFPIPSKAERDGLRVGDLAKCIFLAVPEPARSPKGDRMWIEVSGRRGDQYVGLLRNHPVVVGAAYGDEVVFGPEHVIDLQLKN